MILFKKAMRTIWRGKKSYLACVLLMMLGIMIYTAFNMLYVNLDAAKTKLYTEQAFADAFAKVRGMPLSTAQSLATIDGIEKVAATIAADARVLFDNGDDKIVTLRLHSFDPDDDNRINNFLITQGTQPSDDEILIGDSFFKANGLKIGDTIKLVINGKQVEYTISGAAQSPEYVYAIPDSGSIMPDNTAFGFAYIPYSQLANVTGKNGIADAISFKFSPNIKFEDLEFTLEDELRPFGLISLYPQKDQASNSMINTEITSLGGMATSLPMVFVLMAVIILYIMLKRVIEQERGSIGTLKAFGFSDSQVMLHYLSYGIITGFLGGFLGCATGMLVTDSFTQIYLEYFNLPSLKTQINPALMLNGMLISVLSGVFGAFMGTRGILKLNPSEAMRPPAPRIVTHDALKNLGFLKLILASNGYMALRNITRSKFRSAFVVLGIAFSFALIGITSSYPDMMDKMMLEQFTKIQIYDVKVTLKEPKGYTNAIEAIESVGDTNVVEATLEVPSEIRLNNRKEGTLITALESDATLQKIYDNNDEKYFSAPSDGVYMSAMLAKKLGAKRGDLLMAKTPYTGDDEIPLPVVGIINESLGMNVYIELDAMCKLLNVGKSANSILIRADDSADIKDKLNSADNVAAVMDISETRKVYDDMLKTYASTFVFMQLAGMAVAFAIITNTSSISLQERKREYATLRVLGMHPREIARILGFEYWLLTFIGMIPGIPLLHAIKLGMAGMMESAQFSMPVSVPSISYVTSVLGCLVTVAFCNILSARQIKKFDMVDVLKERE